MSYTDHNIFENHDELILFHAIGRHYKEHHCYNGHPFDIPELKDPTYAELCDRVCKDNTGWSQPDVKAFFSSRLYESNKEYTSKKYCQI